MQAGPKAAPLDRPLPLATLPKAGGPRVVAFIEKFIRVPKGKGARKPLRVRPWQRELICGVFDRPRPRAALWSMPRGNGKSALAPLGLYGLLGHGMEGASVVVVAAKERQRRTEVKGGRTRDCRDRRPWTRAVAAVASRSNE